jgi:hypothetical protein
MPPQLTRRLILSITVTTLIVAEVSGLPNVITEEKQSSNTAPSVWCRNRRSGRSTPPSPSSIGKWPIWWLPEENRALAGTAR